MPHQEHIVAYLDRLYSAGQRAFAFSGNGPADFRHWAGAARPALRELIGLERIRRSCGSFVPSVTLDEPVDAEDHTRQRGVLHTEPHFDVPFWLLKPRPLQGPRPLALFPHGHYADRGLDFAVGLSDDPKSEEEDRDVARQAVRRGFIAIAPATRGFPPACVPDVSGRHGNQNCRSHLLHALLAGRTVIGERVWDLERLLDWAAALPEADASRVLMMGNSGGGVATLYAAACDERVTTAVASCSFCGYVGANGLIHHCDCNVVPGVLGFGEFHDVCGLIAPRRLLVVHGAHDPLFPRAEVERAVAGLWRVFETAGAAASFRHVWGDGGHRFYRRLMWPFVEAGI